ncbi:MAG: hypothetical protein M5U26_13605 [Planctomycetota bacterium]|nr:hypothetical protein [Planctomycetota bacterium]
MLPPARADALGVTPEDRRLILAQVVDEPHDLAASAAIEGKAFKYLLKLCATHDDEKKLDDQRNKEASFENLVRQPNLFRGEIVGVKDAVIVEVDQVPLPDEYGLPGHSVLPAICVAGSPPYVQVYELRILCAPGSDLCEKIKEGIQKDRNPVMRVTGFFLKNHVRRTSRAGEPPWQRPLLIVPEPTFRRGPGSTYRAMSEIQASEAAGLLPSVRFDAPRSEERLVVELLGRSGSRRGQDLRYFVRIDGQLTPADDLALYAQRVQALKARLPQDHLVSAVVVRTPAAPASMIQPAVRALADAGLSRIYVKDETEKLLASREQ